MDTMARGEEIRCSKENPISATVIPAEVQIKELRTRVEELDC